MARNITNLTIKMGLASTKGGIFNLKDTSGSRDTELKMMCPVCQDSLFDQAYHCAAGCTPDADHPTSSPVPDGWKAGDVTNSKCRLEGKKIVPVDAAAVAAAKEAALIHEKGFLELEPVFSDTLEAITAPGSSCYVFVPDAADEFYAVLMEQLPTMTDKALVGYINMRGVEKQYRLEAKNGTLRVQELLRPDETARFAPLSVKPVSKASAVMFNNLIDALVDDYDPEAAANPKTAALRQIIEDAVSGTVTPTTVAPVATKVAPSLADALAASVELAKQQKAAKATKKSA